jgi:hypothetical protein
MDVPAHNNIFGSTWHNCFAITVKGLKGSRHAVSFFTLLTEDSLTMSPPYNFHAEF